jgi:hypothetical protein
VAKVRAIRYLGQRQAAPVLAVASGAQNNQDAFNPDAATFTAHPAENLPIDMQIATS